MLKAARGRGIAPQSLPRFSHESNRIDLIETDAAGVRTRGITRFQLTSLPSARFQIPPSPPVFPWPEPVLRVCSTIPPLRRFVFVRGFRGARGGCSVQTVQRLHVLRLTQNMRVDRSKRCADRRPATPQPGDRNPGAEPARRAVVPQIMNRVIWCGRRPGHSATEVRASELQACRTRRQVVSRHLARSPCLRYLLRASNQRDGSPPPRRLWSFLRIAVARSPQYPARLGAALPASPRRAGHAAPGPPQCAPPWCTPAPERPHDRRPGVCCEGSHR